MSEIQRSFEERAQARTDKPVPKRSERKRSRSVADEISKLQALRDAGALTDEQYAKAVDRVVAQDDGT